MTITRNQVTTVMLMIVLWTVVAWWLIGCDHTIYVSNLDDAIAAEPTATPYRHWVRTGPNSWQEHYAPADGWCHVINDGKGDLSSPDCSDYIGTDQPVAADSTPSASPTNQLPTSIEERR